MIKNNENKFLETGISGFNIKGKNILLVDYSIYTGNTIKSCKKFFIK